MSPSVTVISAAVVCAVLAPVSGQQRQLTFNGVDYTGHQQSNPNFRNNIHVFYGIPYSRQPFGRFRFSRPEPMSKLHEWRLSEEELHRYYRSRPTSSRSCPQLDPFTGIYSELRSTEDCLRIDLFVLDEVFKSQSSPSKRFGLGVLLEGLDFKSSIAAHLNPLVGAFNDQTEMGVLAVVHYRLGAFGFLTTEDEEGPANLGLWDQHTALEFLHQQVVSGGIPGVDEARISVLGFGSGGVSASIHMLNPRTNNLFRTALVSGGSALGPDANVRNARERAFKFGRRVGCTSTNSRKFMNCLRQIDDIQRIVSIAAEPQFLFGPVVDKTHTKDASKVYIADQPEQLMRRESFDRIRGVIYGYPENAGSLRFYAQKAAERKQGPSRAFTTLENRIKFYLSPFQVYDDTLDALAASVKFLYFRNYTDQSVSQNETLFESVMVSVLTDYLSFGPVLSAARIHAGNRSPENQPRGVYVYRRAANRQLPTLGSKLYGVEAARFGHGTYLDDLLQFVGVSAIDEGRDGKPVVEIWRSAFSDFFTKTGELNNQVARMMRYTPGQEVINVIGGEQASVLQLPYDELHRLFWSEYVPVLSGVLDQISQSSQDRWSDAQNYRSATLGTGIALALASIACVAVGVMLWRSRRSQSTSLNRVHFQKVSQGET